MLFNMPMNGRQVDARDIRLIDGDIYLEMWV